MEVPNGSSSGRKTCLGCRDRRRKMDRKAKATIRLMVEEGQVSLIRDLETAKETWTVLKNYHEKVSLNNKSAVLRQLMNLKLNENGNMETHIYTIKELADRLKNMGRTLAEDLIVAILLSSLPKSYDSLIIALDSRPNDGLTLEFVSNKLINQYTRQLVNEVIDKEEVSAFRVNKNKGIKCFFCKREGHVMADCREHKR